MLQKLWLLLSLPLVVAFAGSGFARNDRDRLLELPLLPPVEEIHSLPLTSMLSNLGSRVEGGYVLFGVEILLKGGKEPTITLPRKPAGDLGTGLHEVLRQLPDYEMHVISAHLIEILPRGARIDPKDLLNLRVANFSVTYIPAASILAHPARFIPELRARLTPKAALGTRPVEVYSGPFALRGAEVTLHLQNVTVREIFDRVSEATEHLASEEPALGWVYKVKFDDTPGVPQHTFQSLPSVPWNWREYRGSGNSRD